ncbi:MAG: RND family efflux transporter MFP subunit [Oleispira sp.]|jgi:RND family efflux transporter MFP subunit
MKRLKRLPNSLIIVLILALAILIAFAIIKTAPKPERTITPVKERLVEVIELVRSESRPNWLAGGEVSASQQVDLSSRVSGRVVEVDALAIPGAYLPEGTQLAKLDPVDFQLQLIQKEAAVIQAQAELDIESGQGRVALQDYNRSKNSRGASNSRDTALMLRAPQQKSKQAALLRAKADFDSAQLNLERTQINMPFNGQIMSRSVSIGSQVNTSTVLYTIANSEEYWLEVKVAKAFLPFLDLQQDALIGQSNWPLQEGKAVWHNAKILHVLPEVDIADRQAKLLIAIEKPLVLQPSILIGDYVDVQLFANTLPNSYKISSQYLVGDSVWVVNAQKLYKRTLDILFKGREFVWVDSGFEEGDALLISKLGTITEGTPVRFSAGVK